MILPAVAGHVRGGGEIPMRAQSLCPPDSFPIRCHGASDPQGAATNTAVLHPGQCCIKECTVSPGSQHGLTVPYSLIYEDNSRRKLRYLDRKEDDKCQIMYNFSEIESLPESENAQKTEKKAGLPKFDEHKIKKRRKTDEHMQSDCH